MKERVSDLLDQLESRNIPASYVNDKAQALSMVLSKIPEDAVVGFGDSVTLREIGLVDALEKGPYVFLNPYASGLSFDETLRLKRQALTSDVFVTGANAVTLDGKIVNVDGHGNRVAAMLFGPGKVILVAGVNKIVRNVEEALARIKNKAAVLNVQRHTEFEPMPPCAESGVCTDCASPWRICNKTVIIERQYDNAKYRPVLSLVLVGEALGL